MSSSRSGRRVGNGPNVGSLNPSSHVGVNAPSSPNDRDIWLDITASPMTIKYYDEATLTWIP